MRLHILGSLSASLSCRVNILWVCCKQRAICIGAESSAVVPRWRAQNLHLMWHWFDFRVLSVSENTRILSLHFFLGSPGLSERLEDVYTELYILHQNYIIFGMWFHLKWLAFLSARNTFLDSMGKGTSHGITISSLFHTCQTIYGAKAWRCISQWGSTAQTSLEDGRNYRNTCGQRRKSAVLWCRRQVQLLCLCPELN